MDSGATLAGHPFSLDRRFALFVDCYGDYLHHAPCLRYLITSFPFTTVREWSLRPIFFAAFVVTLSVYERLRLSYHFVLCLRESKSLTTAAYVPSSFLTNPRSFDAAPMYSRRTITLAFSSRISP